MPSEFKCKPHFVILNPINIYSYCVGCTRMVMTGEVMEAILQNRMDKYLLRDVYSRAI